MKRLYYLLFFILVIVPLFIPYETQVVPAWDFRTHDDEGRPLSGILIEQSCYHYTYYDQDLCAAYQDSRIRTNEQGTVSFPERTIRLSAGSRLAKSLVSYPLWFAHGSLGPSAYLSVHSSEDYEAPEQLMTWEPGARLPDSTVLVRSESK
jgi:hypothetical protein